MGAFDRSAFVCTRNATTIPFVLIGDILVCRNEDHNSVCISVSGVPRDKKTESSGSESQFDRVFGRICVRRTEQCRCAYFVQQQIETLPPKST